MHRNTLLVDWIDVLNWQTIQVLDMRMLGISKARMQQTVNANVSSNKSNAFYGNGNHFDCPNSARFRAVGILRNILGRSRCEVALFFRLFLALIYFYHINFSYPVVLLLCIFFIEFSTSAICGCTNDNNRNDGLPNRMKYSFWYNSSTGSLVFSLFLAVYLARWIETKFKYHDENGKMRNVLRETSRELDARTCV